MNQNLTPHAREPAGHLPAPASQPEAPRIYVACLAAYNNGHLHGRWIDLADGISEKYVCEQIRAMLATSPIPDAEEYGIHDFENFAGVQIHEYESVSRVVKLAQFIHNTDHVGGALLAHFGGDIEQAENALEDYAGEFDSITDYARHNASELHTIPEHLAPYIDYDKMGRDLIASGTMYTVQTGNHKTHMFWSR